MMAPDSAAVKSNIETALLSLLQLEQKARQALTLQQLQFVMLNQSRILVDYEQAILWDACRQEVRGASGVPSVDGHAPLTQWLNRRCRHLIRQNSAREIHRLPVHDWPESDQRMAAEHLSQAIIWLPVMDAQGQLQCVLLLSRTQPLSFREKRLLSFLNEAYGYVWQSLSQAEKRKRIRWFPRKKKQIWAVGVLMTAVAMFIPVRQSVLAPAEIVSSTSVMVRMPLSGVIKQLHVIPNSPVRQGDPLVTLDAQRLNEQLAQARQQLTISRAELRLARQQSFYDASRKASITVLEGRQKLAQSQVDYLQQQVSQTEVVSEQDGIALFNDQGDWVGRPLNLGEPIMLIADPRHTQVEVRLAVEDMMPLHKGDEVRFFPNSRPTEPIQASLQNIAYHSTLQNNGRYAFVLKAAFHHVDKVPQMGLKGIAKLYGQKTTLFFYLFRRPLSRLRLWWGAL
jgi:multidrug resistance efflux pump